MLYRVNLTGNVIIFGVQHLAFSRTADARLQRSYLQCSKYGSALSSMRLKSVFRCIGGWLRCTGNTLF
jgi:hypothetical protein